MDSRALIGQYPELMEPSRAPELAEIVAELRQIRVKGLGAVRQLHLPVLHDVAQRAHLTTGDAPDTQAIEHLLRSAVDRLDGGSFQEAAEYTFGLVGGTKFQNATDRRRLAAERMDVTTESFRKGQERQILDQTAEGVLTIRRESVSLADGDEPSDGVRNGAETDEETAPSARGSQRTVDFVNHAAIIGHPADPGTALNNPDVAITSNRTRLVDHPRMKLAGWGASVLSAVLAALIFLGVIPTSIHLPWLHSPTQPSAGTLQSSSQPPTRGAPTSAYQSPTSTTGTTNSPSPLMPVSREHVCLPPNPSDPQLPVVEICVAYWCIGVVIRPDGTVDPTQSQVKLRPRIINNSPTPIDLSAQPSSALRLLVSAATLPESWRPPPLTRTAGDVPVLVSWQGQNYWAIPPNAPHDVQRVHVSATADIYSGFVGSWDTSFIGPGETAYRPLRKDGNGNVIQEGNLVFQTPSGQDVGLKGLAVVDRADPTNVKAVSDETTWPASVDPNSF